jgi:hypothetical protein
VAVCIKVGDFSITLTLIALLRVWEFHFIELSVPNFIWD